MLLEQLEQEWKHIVVEALRQIMVEWRNPGMHLHSSQVIKGRTAAGVSDIAAMAAQKLDFHLGTTTAAVVFHQGSPMKENHFGY